MTIHFFSLTGINSLPRCVEPPTKRGEILSACQLAKTIVHSPKMSRWEETLLQMVLLVSTGTGSVQKITIEGPPEILQGKSGGYKVKFEGKYEGNAGPNGEGTFSIAYNVVDFDVKSAGNMPPTLVLESASKAAATNEFGEVATAKVTSVGEFKSRHQRRTTNWYRRSRYHGGDQGHYVPRLQYHHLLLLSPQCYHQILLQFLLQVLAEILTSERGIACAMVSMVNVI